MSHKISKEEARKKYELSKQKHTTTGSKRKNKRVVQLDKQARFLSYIKARGGLKDKKDKDDKHTEK